MADEAHASMDFGGGVGQPEEIVAVDHSRAQRPSPAKAAAQQSMIAPVVLTQEQFSALLAAVVAQRSAAHAAPMKLGNPGPLGLAGFALTTMVLSIFNTGAFLDAKLVRGAWECHRGRPPAATNLRCDRCLCAASCAAGARRAAAGTVLRRHCATDCRGARNRGRQHFRRRRVCIVR